MNDHDCINQEKIWREAIKVVEARLDAMDKALVLHHNVNLFQTRNNLTFWVAVVGWAIAIASVIAFLVK